MLLFMFGGILMLANAVLIAIRAMKTGDSSRVRRDWRVIVPGWVDMVGVLLLIVGQLVPSKGPLTARDVTIVLGTTLLVLTGVSIAKAQFLSWVFMYLSGSENDSSTNGGGERQ